MTDFEKKAQQGENVDTQRREHLLYQGTFRKQFVSGRRPIEKSGLSVVKKSLPEKKYLKIFFQAFLCLFKMLTICKDIH